MLVINLARSIVYIGCQIRRDVLSWLYTNWGVDKMDIGPRPRRVAGNYPILINLEHLHLKYLKVREGRTWKYLLSPIRNRMHFSLL